MTETEAVEPEGQVQVDPNLVIASLQHQVAGKAREVAEREAIIAQQQQQIEQMKKNIDEMAGAIVSKEMKNGRGHQRDHQSQPAAHQAG